MSVLLDSEALISVLHSKALSATLDLTVETSEAFFFGAHPNPDQRKNDIRGDRFHPSRDGVLPCNAGGGCERVALRTENRLLPGWRSAPGI